MLRATTNERGDEMAVRHVRVVSVPVSDQERAKEFYVEELGFELTREDDSVPGIRWVQVTPRGATTALTLVTWFETMPPGSLQGLVLGLDDLEKDCDQLVGQRGGVRATVAGAAVGQRGGDTATPPTRPASQARSALTNRPASMRGS
jgi:catechol 2,3-dioxygenase-like lactoylglutathione lyase family enzyme